MEETKAGQLRKKFGQLKDIRDPWESLWEDVTDLIATRRSNVDGSELGGKKKGTLIYDGTPGQALQLMTDGMHGYLISPAMLWFKLKMARSKMNDIPEVKKYLEECEEQMYFAFNRSNFYEDMAEYLYDGGSIGTATMYSEEDMNEDRIVFSCRHPGEIYIEQNKYGVVDTVFREFKLSARNAVDRFGKEKLSASLQQAYENNPYQEFEFIHGVYPNEGRDITKLNSENKRFTSRYAQSGGTELCGESGYDVDPYAVWRYRKNSKEVYGRSPAMDAIVEVYGLNQIAKTMLQANQQAVEPAYNVPKEMRGSVRIGPRGMNYYGDTDRTITPVHNVANIPAGVDQQERLERAIEKYFKVEFFLMLSRAAFEGRTLTVPQVMEMQGEKGAILGTTIGRLQGECLNPIIDRVFQIEYEAGRMPPPPDVLLSEEGEDISVEYMGPLAQAQKRLFHAQGIIQGLETAAPLIELFPEARDRIDPDAVIEELFDSSGFPQKAIRSREDAEEIRAARAQMEQQQAQMDMMERAAKVAPGLGKKTEEGSPLAAMEGGV